MKILCYIDIMKNGGAQRVMSNLVNYFAEKGYEIILVNDGRLDNGIQEYELSSKVERYFLADDFTGNFVIKNIKRVQILREIIKEQKPDVILSFLGNCNKRMLISALGINCRKIVSVRNDPKREYGSTIIQKKVIGSLFKQADGVVFQTEEAKQYFPLEVQKKSQVIFNPINERFFSIVRDEKKHIVTLGRLYEQKNHKMLIDAFAKIINVIEDDLYIYGEGPLRKELEEYIEAKGLNNRIFLPGNTNNVEKILSEAKIFVLSSDYEGMPNALLEALGAGVPCISTDCPCGGPRMVINNGNNGLLIKCRDVDALANAISKLAVDRKLRDLLSYNAKLKAEQFAPDKILNDWEKFVLGNN